MLLQSISLIATICVLYPIEADGAIWGWAPKLQGSSRDSGKLRNYYDGIDNFLTQHAQTEDVDNMMQLIEDWIKRESSHTLTTNEALRLRALIQLHNLILTDGPGRCTLSSSSILQNNDLSLRGAISKLMPGEIPKRRIERLVNHYASKFERECDHEVVVKEVEPANLLYVSKVVTDYVNSRMKNDPYAVFQKSYASESIVDQQPETASDFAKKMRGVRPQRDPVVVYRWLLTLAQEKFDPMVRYLRKVRQTGSDKPTVDEGNISKLFRKYIGHPCEQFVEKVEGSFGSSWALAQSKKYHRRMNTEAALYKNLTYFHGCSLLLNNEQKLIDGLVKMIEEQW